MYIYNIVVVPILLPTITSRNHSYSINMGLHIKATNQRSYDLILRALFLISKKRKDSGHLLS